MSKAEQAAISTMHERKMLEGSRWHIWAQELCRATFGIPFPTRRITKSGGGKVEEGKGGMEKMGETGGGGGGFGEEQTKEDGAEDGVKGPRREGSL